MELQYSILEQVDNITFYKNYADTAKTEAKNSKVISDLKKPDMLEAVSNSIVDLCWYINTYK